MNNRRFLSILFIFSNILLGEESPICISLGLSCIPAILLRDFNLRNEAYPLDWLLMEDFEKFYDLLNNDFENFLNSEYLSVKFNYHNNNDYHVYNELYHIRFFHDFPNMHFGLVEAEAIPEINNVTLNILDHLPLVQERYHRRIVRFYQALNGQKKIYFFRLYDISPDQAKKLTKFFSDRFPQLDFTLVIFYPQAEYQGKWDIPHVISYHLPLFEDREEWKRIFKELKLI